MNIMTGYIGATSGKVIINGHNILEEPEKAKKCIGYLPEIPPLYLDMTVSEYLHFAAELKKVPKADRDAQVMKVMELIKLVDMKDRLIKNLSKGYRDRESRRYHSKRGRLQSRTGKDGRNVSDGNRAA